MRGRYSKEVYPELLDFDYSFLPGDYWDFNAEFDNVVYECQTCGENHSAVNPVNRETMECKLCETFGENNRKLLTNAG